MSEVEHDQTKTIIADTIKIIDDAVPAEIYNRLIQLPNRIGWNYGWNTPNNPTARYWHHEVGFGNKRNTECVAKKVREHPAKSLMTYQDWLLAQLPENTKILRFYLNAYTFGTDGWPHTDTDRQDETTAVLYLTQEWKPAWGGETVIFDKHGDVSHSALPRPNRILTFPSNLLHAPRPLSRTFTGLRVVLVVKLGIEDV